jgi:hypothetical protein
MPEDIQQKLIIDRITTVTTALKWKPTSVDTSGATIKMTIEYPREGITPTPVITPTTVTETAIPKPTPGTCPDVCMRYIEQLFTAIDKLTTATDPKIVIDVRDNALNEAYAISNAWKESGYKTEEEEKLRK